MTEPAETIGGFAAERVTSSTGFETTIAEVEPVSHDIVDGALQVLVANRGLEAVEVSSARYILLDEEGAVVFAGRLRGLNSLEPGAEGVLGSYQARFEGSVSTVRAIISFDSPEN